MKKKSSSNFLKKSHMFIIILLLILIFQYGFDIKIKLIIYDLKKSLINIDVGYQTSFQSSAYLENTKRNVEMRMTSQLSNLSKNLFDADDFDLFIKRKLTNFSSDVTLRNKQCSMIPKGLAGPVEINLTPLSIKELENKYQPSNYNDDVLFYGGGHWKPKSCDTHNKVAIIVPYRDRLMHLKVFLNHMHSFLRRQLIDYAIYVIEEVPLLPFNRALLMNIGFVEALKDYDWNCFIFHDVDLLPQDDRNFYHCPQHPRHMSVSINTFDYELPYKEILGGVTAIGRKHFEMINGFSNQYFGWGGEDDDFSERVMSNDLKIARYPNYISKYFMLSHKKENPSKERHRLLEKAKNRFKTDGLNSLRYKVLNKTKSLLYTSVLVTFEITKQS